jgi:hypothetical protein
MGKRRIIIRRTRRPNLEVHKFLQSSYGAGTVKSYSCVWCWFPKEKATDKCAKCGGFAATSSKQSEISQVFLESDPAYSPKQNG